jgi:hypothetical protein
MNTMSERMLEYIRHNCGVTLLELVNHLGADARGDLSVALPGHPNIVLWSDVSEEFVSALSSIQQDTEVLPTSFLTYLYDGGMLTLPIAKRIPRGSDYNKPHWLPIVLNSRRVGAIAGDN